ncbi:MAG: sel1 repeat family protein [Akkermansia sp.]|nr:sel1 repeat family protein [Akkermansia sp.]
MMKMYTRLLAAALLCLPLSAQDSEVSIPTTPVYESSNSELEARLTELKQKAEAGDSDATRQVYTLYAIEGLTGQARAWAERYEQQLTAQAEAGDAKVMMLLATSYLQGRDYMPQDIGKAVIWLTRAAEAGQPSAAYILGEIFIQQHNTQEAENFYKQAYEKYAELCSSLSAPPTTEQRNALYWKGYMELMGIGTNKNPAAGVENMKKADNAWAWSQLYKCYVKGIGVEQDMATAIDYARKLADNADDGMMAWVVGSAYLKGEGVAKDETLGRSYLDKAAAANIAPAIYHKGTLLQAEGKLKEAYDCFNQAASMGLPEAMTATAKLLMQGGEGIEKDEARALNMLQVASDRYEDLRAPYELGLYYDSVGEPEHANAWYKIASDRGVTEAMARRGLLHITPNSGVNWSPTQMYRWWRTGSNAGDADCKLYLNLFLFVFIPLVLIISFGVPILVVHKLNKKALAEEANAEQDNQ